MRARSERGDESAKKWLGQFADLGEYLKVKIK
jgi:hypothetical protein